MENPSHAPRESVGNLRPAPFELTPESARRMIDALAKANALFDKAARESSRIIAEARLDLQSYVDGRIAYVPLDTIKLVNVPRCSEDPRLAKANDDRREPDAQVQESSVAVPSLLTPDGQADVDQTLRGLHKASEPKIALPVDVPRPALSKPVASPTSTRFPVNPAVRFNADLRRAIAFFKARCILVTPTNSRAEVMTYRISGKQHARLGSEVVEMAIAAGMPRDEETL